ncbi:PP2C family protein-serine/threonine phosphatase [Calothrix sp. PCC 6303]|uniref:PP2C family protein-serine/threonine phosphatase n=1 Tax=Calothrix sp. PCC 6303 TaxID=1170562 RepID=UPI0002A01D27|nr:PP2C family protein-serine/threonine phosphatase [Calothrix sp. PCC 6303]AFZ00105.1 protein serine/threonine phosphatase [Calothrix sp. PCC 6303]
MKSIFVPAINLMNRFKYSQKFILISSIFILPLGLTFFLLWSEIQNKNDFTEKEMLGNAYLRPWSKLWKDIPKLQFLNNNPVTNENNQEIQRIKKDIDQAFKLLETADKEFSSSLNTTEKFNIIKDSWQKIKQRQDTVKPELINAEYSSLIQQLDALRVHVGDESNLILDPDIDTYYMMDATLLKLPNIQRTLGEIKLHSQSIILRQQDSINDRVKLIELLAILKQYNQELRKNVENSFNDNPTGNLRPKLEANIELLNNTIDLLTQTTVPFNNNFNPIIYEGFITASERSLKKTYVSWDKSLTELDILLQKRIDTFAGKQILLSIFTSLILILITYLFIGFYLGVKQTVYSLDIASKRMINDNFKKGNVVDDTSFDITLDNRDELGQVVQSFNSIAIALVKSNQEFQQLNNHINNENLRMKAELDFTREVQQRVLPKPQEIGQITDLDIASFMQPASDIGGDYYDVLQQDGHVKIGIGDVTGHGLESGMLMLMVQTAVRTLLESRESDPQKFLDILNRTIYQNVQRMDSDKNMTLCLLDYHDGKVRISGQHEEVLIVRRGGMVQRIDTGDLGFPIGLEENIFDFVAYADVQLLPGDVIVLYTDGITEAEDANGELYGLKRLTQVVKHNWEKDAEEIKQAIIDDLWKYIGQQYLLDDITLVILKQNAEKVFN